MFFFDRHVAKFVGVENFATVLALDVLDVFLSRDNSHSGMLADGIHVGYLVRRYILFGKIVSIPPFLSNPLIDFHALFSFPFLNFPKRSSEIVVKRTEMVVYSNYD